MKINATIVFIEEPKNYERKNKPDLRKQMVGLWLGDDQKIFGEVRLPGLFDKIKEFRVMDTVEVEFRFLGSQKNDIYYNNIIITKIKKV